MKKRIELIRQAGVPLSDTDAEKVSATATASLRALEQAVKGSLFDTEPQTFDVQMRKLREVRR